MEYLGQTSGKLSRNEVSRFGSKVSTLFTSSQSESTVSPFVNFGVQVLKDEPFYF